MDSFREHARPFGLWNIHSKDYALMPVRNINQIPRNPSNAAIIVKFI